MDLEALDSHFCKPKMTCPICPEVFSRQRYLDKHIIQQHNPQQHNPTRKCRNCPQSFVTVQDWKEHRAKVHPTPVCDDCSEAFATVKDWKKHRDLVHPVAVCDDCSESFGTDQRLRFHREKVHRVKKGDNPYDMVDCNHCTKAIVRRHLVLHLQRRHPEHLQTQVRERLSSMNSFEESEHQLTPVQNDESTAAGTVVAPSTST